MNARTSKPNRNKRKYSPIPWLALHIAMFNDGCSVKKAMASARAAMADRVYAASYRIERRAQ